MTHPERFARQTRFAPFGAAGQEALSNATVAVVGLGGLGATLAAHLVRIGVGSLRLIDRDVVEESNLARQMLYTADDAARGRAKAEAAAAHLATIDSGTVLVPRADDLTTRTIDDLLGGSTLVLDGLDNAEARYLLNDWCHRAHTPWVYGGAVGSEGRVLAIRGGTPPCLRCLFGPEPTTPLATCDTVGVLSPLPSMIASLQVAEAMRLLVAPRNAPVLWDVEAWDGRARTLTVETADDDCPCCVHGQYPALDRAALSATTLCGQDTVQIHPAPGRRVSLSDLAAAWQGLGDVEESAFLVRLRLPATQLSVFADGRALIQGVQTAEQARTLYARYVGA